MLLTMLFEDSQVEEKKKNVIENATVVKRCSILYTVLFPLISAVLVAVGVLFLLFQPIPQYFATALCLFAAALVPLFFLVETLVFRLSIGNGKVAVRKIASKESVYPYTDVSWMMQTPDKKRSAILVFVKGQQVARILPGAKNYLTVTELRHKGTLKDGEKAILRALDPTSK